MSLSASKCRWLAASSAVLIMSTSIIAQTTENTPPQVEWNLAEICESLDAWQREKNELDGRVAGLEAFKGRLGESPEALADALDAISQTEKDVVRLYVYAFLEADEDRRLSAAQERRGEAALLLSQLEQAVSFVSPELLSVGSSVIEQYLNREPRLAKHAFNVRNTLRQEPHTLSDEAESIIAGTSSMRQGPERIFAMLSS